MPIRPFLAGHAFDPETITKMSAAFESVCEAFGRRRCHAARCTKDMSSPNGGVKDVETLNAMTLEQFEHQSTGWVQLL
jgi:hypothetical protein